MRFALLLFVCVCAVSAQVLDLPTWTWDTIGTNMTHHTTASSGVFPDTITNTHYQILIAYPGWNVTLGQGQLWTEHLAYYFASAYSQPTLDIYAAGGPIDSLYQEPQEIGNIALIADLHTRINHYAANGNALDRIVVIGHSSGTFVAHQLIYLLANGYDEENLIRGKMDYFCLDGGNLNLTKVDALATLRNLVFVYANDTITNTLSPNHRTMIHLASHYAATGISQLFEVNSDGSGCDAGAVWCVHTSLINLVPWDPTNAAAFLDYAYFAPPPHGLTTAYLRALDDQ